MIAESDLDRLRKLLGMLSSDFDGERANAGALIAHMAKRLKMTIPELCSHLGTTVRSKPEQPQQPQQRRPQQKPREAPPRQPKASKVDRSAYLRALYFVASHFDLFSSLLNGWERSFMDDILATYRYDEELSERQFNVVKKILKKTYAGEPV